MSDYREHRYRSACGRLDLFARDYPGPEAAGGPGARADESEDGSPGDASGSRPPLLLMHGLTRNSADFEPLVEHLAGRWRLIVPDQRGRGLSAHDPDPANYRVDVYASDMFALLDKLGIARAGLIGTSMGGLMAMVMAATQPERVSAIVLNDIGPELEPTGLARIATYVGGGEPFADLAAAAARTADIHREAFPDFEAADWEAFARRTCRVGEDGAAAFAYDPAIALAFDTPDGVAPPDLWPLWQAIGDKPVLVVRGALSDLLAEATVTRMAELHPGTFEAVDVPGRGHAPLLDEPEALAAIETFLDRHAR